MAKLTDLSVSFLSLVKTPATGKGLTLKAADGERPAAFDLVVKNDDMMRAYGVVYAPDQEDAHGDTADADTIRKAQAEFMREGRLKNIDTEHSFTSEMAYVAESWLVRKGDPLFPDEPEGSWAVGIQIGDPDLWKQLKSGELTGISLAGIARMEPGPDDPAHPRYTEKDAEIGLIARLIKALTGAPHQEPVEETDMTKDEVQALVAETLKSVLPDALKDASQPAGDPAPKADAAELEKAKELLKANGIDVPDPAPKADEDDLDAKIAKAVEKAVGTTKGTEKSIDQKIDDAVTKALAKGVTETDPTAGATEESFA
ncbi:MULTISPECIES: XkdF-like putative serine protease domain-containing protein [Rhodobacterales]|uniref:Putative phage serine protease XkdF n=1 Tax=Sulfitobacter delicatus TaxID=218672 RepID=A0A1G7S7G6_9RHOB|nr:XkdF-like putative serine protease domain-containing protein [Sulfitobacter delicatus]SDG18884.1 Putative phage serine protease XkdF [Sulfitobacter delicatus]